MLCARNYTVDPVFTKTSQNARFLLSENERFGLVFVKTGSINSGTVVNKVIKSTEERGGGFSSKYLPFFRLYQAFLISVVSNFSFFSSDIKWL
jgi:hypothetical protein